MNRWTGLAIAAALVLFGLSQIVQGGVLVGVVLLILGAITAYGAVRGRTAP